MRGCGEWSTGGGESADATNSVPEPRLAMRCTALTTSLQATKERKGLSTHIPKHSKKTWESKEPENEGKNGITCLVPRLTRERWYLTQARGRERQGWMRSHTVMRYGTLNGVGGGGRPLGTRASGL